MRNIEPMLNSLHSIECTTKMYSAALLLSAVRKDNSVMYTVLKGPAKHRPATNISRKKVLTVEGEVGSPTSEISLKWQKATTNSKAEISQCKQPRQNLVRDSKAKHPQKTSKGVMTDRLVA